MLAAGDAAAANLDLIATLENRVSGGVNATQTSSTTYQPRAHVPLGDGHLHLSESVVITHHSPLASISERKPRF